MDSQADELLQALEKEGKVDSSGCFTVDPRRARELLQSKLLADPHFYALCLVSAALAGGARRLRLHCDASRFDLHYDGQSYTPAELESLGQEDWTATAHPHLRSLRYGLRAAWGLGPHQITLETRDENAEEGYRLRMQGESGRFEPSTRLAAGNRLLIEFPRRILPRRLHQETLACLRDRCRWIREQLIVNGETLGEALPSGRCLAQRELARPYPGKLMLDSSWRGLYVVNQGVWVEHGDELEFPLSGVVYCDDLQKDLSQAQFVENESWRQLCEALREEGRLLVLSLLDNWEEQEISRRLASVPFLDKLAEVESRSGNLAIAQSIYERLLVLRAQRSEFTDPDVLTNLSNLATLHTLQERPEQALGIFLAIAEDLHKVGRFEEAETYFARAFTLEPRLPVNEECLGLLIQALVGWAEAASVARPTPDWAADLAGLAFRRLERFPGYPQGPAVRARLKDLLAFLDQRGRRGPLWVQMAQGRLCSYCGSGRIDRGRRLEGLPVLADVCQVCGHMSLFSTSD